VTFIAFLFFGFLPLIPYIFSFGSFTLSGAITGVAFVSIGYLKGIMNHKSILLSILQTVLLGSIAAAVAYYAGVFLEGIF
jgi:VIT1/CCC1 family predicted Fe2+/Mn2+ transporter